jgi:hypothetical protein
MVLKIYSLLFGNSFAIITNIFYNWHLITYWLFGRLRLFNYFNNKRRFAF